MLLLLNFFYFPPILLVFHCFFIFFFKKWIGAVGTFYTSMLVFVFSLFISLNNLFFMMLNGNYYYLDFGKWFFCLDLMDSHIMFCMDSLSFICSILVLVLTSLALYFGIEYMYSDSFMNSLLYLLNMFSTSVIFLFFCYDFFLMILAWECMGLFSLLLVNFYSMSIYTIKAAFKTFIFSSISDMFMFLAFMLSMLMFNTTDLSLIFLQMPFFSFHYLFMGNIGIHFLTFFSFLISLSGVIKAAQFFFHVWLPDAMEAPTPASALIHSSTLVMAGIFLIMSFSLLFEFTIVTNYFLAILGSITLLFGSVTAVFQNDIKKLVAYSTMSQIGYLTCGCGFCCYEEVLMYLILHALNKAFLFILVGYIVHFFNGNTDLRQMGGMYLYSFDMNILLFGVCFNLTGLPYSAGFLGKEFLMFQLFKDDWLSLLISGSWLISFIFTPIYMFMLNFMVFYGPKKGIQKNYFFYWKFNLFYDMSTLINFQNKLMSLNKLKKFLIYSFQFVMLTSSTTIYILFFFWLFFFFFGEFLLLLMLNFSSLNDIITSNLFFSFKFFNVFLMNNNSFFLTKSIFFFITFFFFIIVLFLMNLNYKFNYFYLNNIWILDFFFFIIIIFFFYKFILFFILFIYFIYFIYFFIKNMKK